jgi:hypothetical protein
MRPESPASSEDPTAFQDLIGLLLGDLALIHRESYGSLKRGLLGRLQFFHADSQFLGQQSLHIDRSITEARMGRYFWSRQGFKTCRGLYDGYSIDAYECHDDNERSTRKDPFQTL